MQFSAILLFLIASHCYSTEMSKIVVLLIGYRGDYKIIENSLLCKILNYYAFVYVNSKGKREYYINKSALLLVGAKIREIRLSKNISIEYLANTSGMDYSQLARMETGQVNFTISYLFRVAEALGVTPKDLLP